MEFKHTTKGTKMTVEMWDNLKDYYSDEDIQYHRWNEDLYENPYQEVKEFVSKRSL